MNIKKPNYKFLMDPKNKEILNPEEKQFKEDWDLITPYLAKYYVHGASAELTKEEQVINAFCRVGLNNKDTGGFRQFAANNLLGLEQSYKKHGIDGLLLPQNIGVEHKSSNVIKLDSDKFYSHSINDYNMERYEEALESNIMFMHSSSFRGRLLTIIMYPISAILFSCIEQGLDKKCLNKDKDKQRPGVVTVKINNPKHIHQEQLMCVYFNPTPKSIPYYNGITKASKCYGWATKRLPFKRLEELKLERIQTSRIIQSQVPSKERTSTHGIVRPFNFGKMTVFD